MLQKNIIATVTYYDVLDFPLTAYEVWRNLISYEEEPLAKPVGLAQVIRALEEEGVAKKLSFSQGFICLPGREALVAERIRREKISAWKLRRMRKLARLMSYLPYVRMIGATGSLSFKHGTKRSDWDMFIVFRQGKIWLGRMLVTAFLQLIGKRRHGAKIRDRACLNYFVTEDNLEIAQKDLYSAHEYQHLIPLYGREAFSRFQLANRWIKNFKPSFSPLLVMNRLSLPASRFQQAIQSSLEALCDLFPAGLSASWQREKIRKNPKTGLAGSLIEATDRALIFLPSPRGPKVFTAFKERLHF